ncbi:MAG: hypothetical protein AUK55_05530 [Syntrophobacteraceae bacterium CG2_30_61_12]|nr:MAG: hypothetical protein AUK55_05530 [Syntrophobacteraceae bacterium CG2_30_61_12]
MDWLTDPGVWGALIALTALEIVLGIDNIIFIAILAGKLPRSLRTRARTVGLLLAMGTRIGLLCSITLIMQLTEPLFAVLGMELSGRDLILLLGGIFLLAKSTIEIHGSLEGRPGDDSEATLPNRNRRGSFAGVVTQIALLDIVFSFDSVITAIGLARQLWVMIAAIMLAVAAMIMAVGRVSAFVDDHPTIKVLALSFLLLIGVSLVAEGLGHHIPKGYIYFAMAFSAFVEMLNLRVRGAARSPVKLHHPRSDRYGEV